MITDLSQIWDIWWVDKSDIRFVLDLSLRQISLNSIFRPVNLLVLCVLKTNTVNVFYWTWKILSPDWKARGLHSTVMETKLPELLLCKSKRVDNTIKEEIASFIFNDMVNKRPWLFYCMETTRGDEWSLRAFASMPSTAIFFASTSRNKKLLCELANSAKIWGAQASEPSFKFYEQIEQR